MDWVIMEEMVLPFKTKTKQKKHITYIEEEHPEYKVEKVSEDGKLKTHLKITKLQETKGSK